MTSFQKNFDRSFVLYAALCLVKKSLMPNALGRSIKRAHRQGKAHYRKYREYEAFQYQDAGSSGAKQAKAQHVDLPRHRLDARDPLEPSREIRQRIEHTAEQHQKNVSRAGNRIECIHAPQSNGKDAHQKKPAGCGRHDDQYRQKVVLHSE